MNTLRLLLALVLSAAVLTACDSGEDSFQIGGEYSGITEDFGDGRRTTVTFDIPDTDTGESFTFAASIEETTPGGTNETMVTGTGTYDHPEITITLDGELSKGEVSEDGDSFVLEVEPGDFVTFRR